MNPGSPRPMPGEEARLVLAGDAGRAARRNQPRVLLTAAIGVLAIALVLLLTAVSRRSSAEGRLRTEREKSMEIARLIEALGALQNADLDAEGHDRMKPDSHIGPRIEEFARAAELRDIVPAEGEEGTRSGSTPQGLHRRRYSVKFEAQEAEPLLLWIERVTQELAGVELSLLEIEPATATAEGKPRWKGSVAFTRWERRS